MNIQMLDNGGRQQASGSRVHGSGQPQLELGFSGSVCRSSSSHQRRRSRANWWFQRMRQIVDRACDWEPVPVPRPEQIWFPGAHRQPLAVRKADEVTVVTT
jgi:hypothetical protein